MRSSLWLALVLVCLLPAGAFTRTEMLSRLRQADRLLQQAQQHPERQRDLLREAARTAPEALSPALQRLGASPTRTALEHARAELGSAQRALAPAAGSVARHGRADLEAVLADREFQPLQPAHLPPWLLAFREWWHGVWMRFNGWWKDITEGIYHWVKRIFPRVQQPTPLTSAMGVGLRWVFIALLIAGLLALLGIVVARLIIHHQRGTAPEHGEESTGMTRRLRQAPSPWDYSLTEAQAQWEHGQSREALRVVLRACLLLLDTRGVLRYDETRANGEVLRELRRQGRASVSDRLRPIVRTFDRGWYGYLPVSGEEFAQVLATSRQFRDTVVGEP